MEAPEEFVDAHVRSVKENNVFSLSEDQIKQLAKYFTKEQIAWSRFNKNKSNPNSPITPSLLEFMRMVLETKPSLDIHIDNAGKPIVIKIKRENLAALLELLPQHGRKSGRLFDYDRLAKTIADKLDANQLMDLACLIIIHEAEKDIANSHFQHTACTLFQENLVNIALLNQLSHLENNRFIVQAYKKRAKGDTDIEKAQNFLTYIAKKKRKHKLPKISAFIFRVLYHRLTSRGLYDREGNDSNETYFPEAGELKIGTLYNQRFISGALVSTYESRADAKRRSRHIEKYNTELNQVRNFTTAFTALLNESAEWKALCKAICFETPLNQSVTEALDAIKKTKGEFTTIPSMALRAKILNDLQQVLMVNEEEESLSSEIASEECNESSQISSQNDWQDCLSDLDSEENPAPPLLPPSLATRDSLNEAVVQTHSWRDKMYNNWQAAKKDVITNLKIYLCITLMLALSITMKLIMLVPSFAPLSSKIAEGIAKALYAMHLSSSIADTIPTATILAAMSPDIIGALAAGSYGVYGDYQLNKNTLDLPLVNTTSTHDTTSTKKPAIALRSCWNSCISFFKAEKEPYFQLDPSAANANPIFDPPVNTERTPLLGTSR